MLLSSREWDVDLLHDIFEERDALAIRQIPLSAIHDPVGWQYVGPTHF